MSTQTASSLSPGPLALAALIFLAALSRLIPHPPNFSPVEAVALFGGAYFANRTWALVVPLIGMFVSDLALGLLNGGIYFDYFVSAGFALIYLCIALSAAKLAAWFARSPRWLAAQRYFMGTVLAALAVRLALEPRRAA